MTPAFSAAAAFSTRPTLRGSFGMVSATHWLATAAAQSVLERGGNAFDAAAAGGFVLHVVEPHLNGPGGDMTAIIAPAGMTPRVLMGQGPAPARASIGHVRAEGLEQVPGAGGLAAAVPGAVDAWFHLLATQGSWELADILAYAIDYARNGHPVGGRVAATIGAVRELFVDHWPSSAALWMPHGRPPVQGENVRNEAYARTLDWLVEAGAAEISRAGRIEAARREWGSGFVARAAEEFLAVPHRHSTGTDHAAVLGAGDFAAFRASYEPCATLEFRGVTVAKSGPWAQGPVLLQALAILDGFPDELLDPSTEAGVHTIAEALKLAMADRDAYYGDPEDPSAVPLKVLLSAEYAAERRTLITETASHDFRPGTIEGFTPYLPPLLTESEWLAGQEDRVGAGSIGEPTVSRSGETRGDTCHIAVTDQAGNMIAATPSGGWLQSSPAVPELGFCLGSRLQMTWLDEASPSALRPGGRPRSTLTPTMVLRDGAPVAALGSPGGDQQEQWQLLYLLRTLVGGHAPQQAIDAPAFHTTSLAASFWPRTWEPDGLVVEDRLGEDVIAALARRGHLITRAGDWALGRLCVVGREDGFLYAAANPRGAQGYAAGR
ncbi:MAG TPA: gamma-glutamyltransferase [Micrococcaceae bacterium]